MTRQQMIDEAVRRAYPFMLHAENPFANPVIIKRVARDDERTLMERPYLVEAIRAAFRQIATHPLEQNTVFKYRELTGALVTIVRPSA